MELKTWYKATDQYDNYIYYNYIVELSGNIVKYYSVSLADKFVEYIEEDYDNFKEDILDNYEFEEVDEKSIIMECFNGI